MPSLTSFGRKIINWYQKHKRELPWRDTKDPYHIWLSEIILQQTRVDQGMAYYLRFVETYPTVKSLAAAGQDNILKLWQGLGYYSRARNLHHAAQEVVKKYNGAFPSSYNDIRSLKGIGDYTAAAISSFAFDLPYAVVDGNVYRLLSRYFGIETPIDSTSGKKQFAELAQKLLNGHAPAVFNQAIMEFGAIQCKPVSPECTSCPLADSCLAFDKKRVSELPVKQKKTAIRKRYFHYLVIHHNKYIYLRQRTGKDIWQGLHDFPLIERSKHLSPEQLIASAEWKEIFGTQKTTLVKSHAEIKHILSHQHIHARFYEMKAGKNFRVPKDSAWKKATSKTLHKYAIPRLIEQYFENNA